MAKEITPWKPFRELGTLRNEMDRLWDNFFGEWPSTEGFRGEWAPTLDVSENKSNFVVRAEVPGMDAKDIDISLSNGILTIRGEKKQEKEDKDENYHRIERSYGTFSRSVRLPSDIKTDRIKATCQNGVLKITMPKSEEAKKKEVKIQVS